MTGGACQTRIRDVLFGAALRARIHLVLLGTEWRKQIGDVSFGTAVLCIAYGLKRHYSAASASELTWVLGPTATIVTALTGASFSAEQGVGYVARDLRTAIVPGCAGVNFLIVALCTFGFGFVRSFGTTRAKALWLLASATLAYATTIVVNSVRIALGVTLHDSVFTAAWLPAGEAHRDLGILVYLAALWGSFSAIDATIGHRVRERAS